MADADCDNIALTVKEGLNCALEPWRKAFSHKNIVHGYEMTGMYPFHRRAYHEILKREQGKYNENENEMLEERE